MAKHGAEPEGIGGWLLALLVITGVIAPLLYGYVIWGALGAQATLASYGAEAFPLYRVQTILWTLAAIKLAIAWSITGALLFFRTRAALYAAIAGIWLLSVGTVFTDWAGLSLAGEEAFRPPLWHVAIWIAEGLALAIPATWYLLGSKRVANTYPRPGAAEALAETFD